MGNEDTAAWARHPDWRSRFDIEYAWFTEHCPDQDAWFAEHGQTVRAIWEYLRLHGPRSAAEPGTPERDADDSRPPWEG